MQSTHSSPLDSTRLLQLLLHNIPLSQIAWLWHVQNNAARLITRTSKHDHITPVLKELPVESRITFKMLVITFKMHQRFGSVLSGRTYSTTKVWQAPTSELCANNAPRHNKEVYWWFGICRSSTSTVEWITRTFVHPGHYLCLERFKDIFLLDISINSNWFEMTDIVLEFLFSVIHVLISVYVLD